MLRTALEVVAVVWAVSGLGVAIWAAHELRRPGLIAADLTLPPAEERVEGGGGAVPSREGSGTRDGDDPVDVLLPGAEPRRTG